MMVFLNINQEQVGPFQPEQVNQMLATSQVSLETLAWKEGMANWEPLSSTTFPDIGRGTGTPQPLASPQNINTGRPIENQKRGNSTAKNGSAIGDAFTFFKANAVGSIGWLIITSALSSTVIGCFMAPLLGVNFFACVKNFRESGKTMDLGELFDFSKAVEKILGPIVLGVIIGFGFVFLIIPGFIFSMWWAFSPCVLADRPDLSFTDAMKESRLVAKGNWLKLIILFIVIGLLQVLGALCFGVGLLVTIPVGHVALYCAYDQCKKST